MAPARQPNADAQLLRAIGLPGLAANIVNTTIGASIFVLPGTMAKMLGGAAPVAFIVCAIAQAIFVTCFAMAGSRGSLTRGPFAFRGYVLGGFLWLLPGVVQMPPGPLRVS